MIMRPLAIAAIACFTALLTVGTACDSDNDLGAIDPDIDDDIVPGEPVSDAGPDQIVAPLSAAQLDGTKSYDPGGSQIANYEWTLTSKPDGSTAEIPQTTLSRPVFVPDLIGNYVAELRVQNSLDYWDSTPDTVTIQSRPIDGFYVQLTWNTPGTDMDLHIVQSGANFLDPVKDCYFCNRNPEWGVSGALDNPFLQADEDDGYGPEVTTIDAPADGSYRIITHYYGTAGSSLECAGPCPPTVATITLFIDGVQTNTWNTTLHEAGDVWEVATITWPSKSVAESNSMSKNLVDGC